MKKQTAENFSDIAKFIDYMMLDPHLTEGETLNLCRNAITCEVASVIVKPCYVRQAFKTLKGTSVCVGTVIGFPFGVNTEHVKLEEAKRALSEGATELELVINWGYLQENDSNKTQKDFEAVCGLAHMNLAITKVVIECSQLTKDQKVEIAKVAANSGADFIFPASGYWRGNTSLADIQIIQKNCGNTVHIKAAGNIQSIKMISEYLDVGCSRIGIINLDGIFQ